MSARQMVSIHRMDDMNVFFTLDKPLYNKVSKRNH